MSLNSTQLANFRGMVKVLATTQDRSMPHSKPPPGIVTGLEILGIDPSAAPTATPPKCLSTRAAKHWIDILVDNTYRTALYEIGNIPAWFHIMGEMHNWARDNTEPYLSFEYSGRSVQNEVVRKLSKLRAKTTQVVDRSELFKHAEIMYHYSGIDILPTNTQHPEFRIWTHARMRPPNVDDFFERLTEETRFSQHASEWVYSGALGKADLRVMRTIRGATFICQVNGGKVYIPEDMADPVPLSDKYSEYVLQELWAPLVRRFRYRTVKNANLQF